MHALLYCIFPTPFGLTAKVWTAACCSCESDLRRLRFEWIQQLSEKDVPNFISRSRSYPVILFTYGILLTNPSARAGYDTMSIFKWSLTGLNSEFSFSSTSCLPKAEEHSLPYYLPIAGVRIFGFIPFPRVLVLCECNQSGFEIVSPCPYPAMITITPRVPPFTYAIINYLFRSCWVCFSWTNLMKIFFKL